LPRKHRIQPLLKTQLPTRLTCRFSARDDGATLDDLREAVTTLEETKRTTRRVMGGAHPTAAGIERDLHNARVVLRARETPTDELDEVENA
jgi:hypothetical protein